MQSFIQDLHGDIMNKQALAGNWYLVCDKGNFFTFGFYYGTETLKRIYLMGLYYVGTIYQVNVILCVGKTEDSKCFQCQIFQRCIFCLNIHIYTH